MRDFPVGPVTKTPCSNAAGLNSISGQGTKPHVLKLRPSAAKKNKGVRSDCRNFLAGFTLDILEVFTAIFSLCLMVPY